MDIKQKYNIKFYKRCKLTAVDDITSKYINKIDLQLSTAQSKWFFLDHFQWNWKENWSSWR